MAARSMPKRVATFSAVWPIDSPTTGSVRPLSRPMTGARLRSEAAQRGRGAQAARGIPAGQPAHHVVREQQRRAHSASTPPATTSANGPTGCWRWPSPAPACQAQLRITVQPGTRLPQPRRSAITRPMLTSSGEGAAQPMMTSSTSVGEKGWQQRAPGLHGQVARRKRAGARARLQERRAGPVHHIYRFECHPCVLGAHAARRSAAGRIAPAPRSKGKSSTLTTVSRKVFLRLTTAYSSSVRPPA